MTETLPTAAATRRPRRRTVVLAVLVIVGLLLVAGMAWFLWPQSVLPEAEAAMTSNPAVEVTTDGGVTSFRPTAAAATTGLIVYPGAKVPVMAYAPMARAVAEAGYAAYLVDMPLNLAILGADRGSEVQAANPDIRTWVIWGHSLGAAMAGQTVAVHPGQYQGFAMCGGYPNGDLSDQPIPAASIYGTLDAAAERITSDATRAQLPPDAVFVAIDGGNHENCGWYEGQPNDPEATISREAQQAEILRATLEVLRQAGEG